MPGLEELKGSVASLVEKLQADERLNPASVASRRGIEILEEYRAQARSLGLWGLALGKELGGHGLSLKAFASLARIMGRSPWAHYVFGCQAPEAGNIELLSHFANDQQKQQVLLPLVEGKIRSCFAMTEKSTSGANPTLLATRALKQADGSWLLNGEKWFTTAAHESDYTIVMAVTDPNADRHRRSSLFLLPSSQQGMRHVRRVSVMGHEGYGPFSHSELVFEDCRVEASQLLGEEGSAFQMAQSRLAHGRIHHCARWLGIAEQCLDWLIARANSRQISDASNLASSDIVKLWVAESAAQIKASQLMIEHTAGLIDEKGSKSAQAEIAMLKFYVAGMLSRVMDTAVQSFGAAGVSDDSLISYFYREERAARIYDGPDEVHKLALAKRLLRGDGLC